MARSKERSTVRSKVRVRGEVDSKKIEEERLKVNEKKKG